MAGPYVEITTNSNEKSVVIFQPTTTIGTQNPRTEVEYLQQLDNANTIFYGPTGATGASYNYARNAEISGGAGAGTIWGTASTNPYNPPYHEPLQKIYDKINKEPNVYKRKQKLDELHNSQAYKDYQKCLSKIKYYEDNQRNTYNELKESKAKMFMRL